MLTMGCVVVDRWVLADGELISDKICSGALRSPLRISWWYWFIV
jgi:hypothetical protein